MQVSTLGTVNICPKVNQNVRLLLDNSPPMIFILSITMHIFFSHNPFSTNLVPMNDGNNFFIEQNYHIDNPFDITQLLGH